VKKSANYTRTRSNRLQSKSTACSDLCAC
jgi:hypothetical protein